MTLRIMMTGSRSPSQTAFHFEFLNKEFLKRKQKNSRYSMRAFARQIGVHPSTLSSVLTGKRILSVKDAYNISERLEFSPKDKKEFFSSIFEEKKRFPREVSWEIFSKKNALSGENAFEIISQWEHYVMLSLIDIEDFQADFSWMGSRLGVSASRAEEVFKRLLNAGLLKVNQDGSVERTKNFVASTDEKLSYAVQLSHKDSLKAANAALSLALDKRDLTSIIFLVDAKGVAKMKKEIRRFHSRILKISRECKSSEVYELMMSLFPRTK